MSGQHYSGGRCHGQEHWYSELYCGHHGCQFGTSCAGWFDVLSISPQVQVAPVDILELFLSASFWAATIRIACPLLFATLGELICERAGVLNLGIEGIMTVGAMAGWMWVYQGGDLWGGILFAAFIGALFGLLHAQFSVVLGLSQHVTGIGITL
ncbi:MAG: hypothetical protein KTR32_16185, partial [Granulosicoccus sp.]|nr:hypothetical protein [Granulosicoccus sp.]